MKAKPGKNLSVMRMPGRMMTRTFDIGSASDPSRMICKVTTALFGCRHELPYSRILQAFAQVTNRQE
jgi:hypothetical protein